MDITEVLARIERTAPLRGAAAWDKSGVQIAGPGNRVGRLALTLDPLPGVLQAALDWGAELLVTHHPLTLEPRFLDRLDDHFRATALVITHQAWLYAAHTSLDANPSGPAGWLPRELGLTKLAVLEPVNDDDPRGVLGLGLVGDLPEPLSLEALTWRLAELVPPGAWRMSGPEGSPTSPIRRPAVCPGSGGSLMDRAAALGADLLITGDLRYHAALAAPLPVLDVGHFALEEEMMRRLARELATDGSLPGVEIRFFPGRDPQRPHAARGEQTP